MRFLAQRLGADLRATFATNTLFMRGDTTGLSRGDRASLWNVCASWHREWLATVQPRVIVCGGALSFQMFRGLLERVTEDFGPIPMYNVFSMRDCVGELVGKKRLCDWSAPADAMVSRDSRVEGRSGSGCRWQHFDRDASLVREPDLRRSRRAGHDH